MFIGTCFCDFKCCTESNISPTVCQNNSLNNEPIYEIDDAVIIKNYIQNPISKAVVFGGLEPIKQFAELLSFCRSLRMYTQNPIIIYTGYYPDEIENELRQLKKLSNIIIKFGRFLPNQSAHFDPVLGIDLISPNQWAEKIS